MNQVRTLQVCQNVVKLKYVNSYQQVRGERGWIHSGSSLGRWAHCNKRRIMFSKLQLIDIKTMVKSSLNPEKDSLRKTDDCHFVKESQKHVCLPSSLLCCSLISNCTLCKTLKHFCLPVGERTNESSRLCECVYEG